jgi:hypothetical protein
MSTPNMISGSTPINPVLAMPNLPAPQVISGTLGQQGNPPIVNPPLDLASFMNTDTSTLTDVLGSFTINTSMQVGTELFSTHLPIIRGAKQTIDQRGVTTIALNWANVALCSHMYYNPINHIGFVVIAPEPVKGKLLAIWNPAETVSGLGRVAPLYSARRRMITEEWDLAESKCYFRTFMPNGLINQMPTEEQPLPRSPSRPVGSGVTPLFVAPSYDTPTQFRRFGKLSLFLEQEIQVGSIFPKEYTVIVFTCFAGTRLSVPVDPRRAAFSNGRDSLLVAHNNFEHSRFNGQIPTLSKTTKTFRAKPNPALKPTFTISKPPRLPVLTKYNV